MRVRASVAATRARECGRGSGAMALCERGGATETLGLGSPLARDPAPQRPRASALRGGLKSHHQCALISRHTDPARPGRFLGIGIWGWGRPAAVDPQPPPSRWRGWS